MEQNQNIQLQNHLDFFITKNKISQNSVTKEYSSKADIIQALQKLILSTNVGTRLKKCLDYFVKEDKIVLGSFDNFKGRLVYSKENMYKCTISLDVSGSIFMLGAILVHELRHFQDFTNVFTSKALTPISVFATEVNAFSDTYLFFKEIDYLGSDEYIKCPEVLKNLFKYSELVENKYDFNASSHMSFLLEKLGYANNQQKTLIYPKISQTSLENDLSFRSTKDELSRRFLTSNS